MPRIEAVRVGPYWFAVWVAFTMNDYGEMSDVRLGISREHARVRSLRAYESRLTRRA